MADTRYLLIRRVLTLGLEAGGPTIQLSETVEAGWNNVVFDVSSAAGTGHSKAVVH